MSISLEQFPTSFSLANLNGQNGVKIAGENSSDQSGNSVRIAGDVNGDGVVDIIVGAPNSNVNAGACYVVFGHTGNWTSPFSLSTLNGINGVKFIGSTNDYIGQSVSSAGDVNGDGIADFIIGGNRVPGISYVVFGHTGNWTSPFSLSSLNGANGVIFNSGRYAVSEAGDVNGDGVADLLVGDPFATSQAGVSYVVFGHTGNWTSPFSLSSLNGANGVIFNGKTQSNCGYSVSGVGDVNGDEIADIMIGAPSVGYGLIGESYVVFGHTGSWSSPFNLSTLNGSNGVKFNGESSSDFSGISVCGAGDVNGDGINDLLIGADNTPSSNFAGSSYVVFGHSGSWASSLSLSTLNGANGVIFNGENSGDHSGWSVSEAGDVNGDGIADLIIGAPNVNSIAGSSYCVFGHNGSWATPISLSNGFNGIKLIGNTADQSGYSVSKAGDVNGDGITDLIIGAPKANTQTGVSYIVFGSRSPILFNNQMTIPQNATLTLNSNNLSTINGTKPIQFVISNLQHGHFEFVNQPGQIISNFLEQQVRTNQVNFVHDGTCNAPAYQVTANDGGIGITTPTSAAINFTPIYPNIITNQLTIDKQEVSLTQNNLNTADPGDNPLNIIYNMNALSDVQHGQFIRGHMRNVPIIQFTQQEVNDGFIQFLTDNSGIAPNFTLTAKNSCGLVSNPSTANIQFKPNSDEQSNSVRNGIIAGSIIGGVGLFFLILKRYCSKKSKEKSKVTSEIQVKPTDIDLQHVQIDDNKGKDNKPGGNGSDIDYHQMDEVLKQQQRSKEMLQKQKEDAEKAERIISAERKRQVEAEREQKLDKEQQLVLQNRDPYSVSFVLDYSELKIGKELGRGGFGIVYHAIWRHNNVAVKQLLNKELSKEATKEFEAECQIMPRLRSPNIVQFYGYCPKPNYCLVMEYMPQGSLYSVLHSDKSLDWSIRGRIATDIACGLAFLHHENILHRDIKSLNVLLNDQWSAKLTDFGLSRVKSENQSTSTANKGTVGTLAWMAPELSFGDEGCTKATDIYSMGVTFWELASRQVPFTKVPKAALIPLRAQQGYRDDIPQDCPKKLASLIRACWDNDPQKRPTADLVIDFLKSDKEDFATFLPGFRNFTASTQKSDSNPVETSRINSELYSGIVGNLASGIPLSGDKVKFEGKV